MSKNVLHSKIQYTFFSQHARANLISESVNNFVVVDWKGCEGGVMHCSRNRSMWYKYSLHPLPLNLLVKIFLPPLINKRVYFLRNVKHACKSYVLVLMYPPQCIKFRRIFRRFSSPRRFVRRHR